MEKNKGLLNDFKKMIHLVKYMDGKEFINEETGRPTGKYVIEDLGDEKYKYSGFEFEVVDGELNMTFPEFYEDGEIEGEKPSISEIRAVIADYYDLDNRSTSLDNEEVDFINSNLNDQERKKIFGRVKIINWN